MSGRRATLGARVALGAYEAVAGAAVAVARVALLGGAGEAERAERLGEAVPACAPGALLLHAVSAGEVVAASALASELERAAPGLRIVLTTGTRDRSSDRRARGEAAGWRRPGR